jgi:hypothetical protein
MYKKNVFSLAFIMLIHKFFVEKKMTASTCLCLIRISLCSSCGYFMLTDSECYDRAYQRRTTPEPTSSAVYTTTVDEITTTSPLTFDTQTALMSDSQVAAKLNHTDADNHTMKSSPEYV